MRRQARRKCFLLVSTWRSWKRGAFRCIVGVLLFWSNWKWLRHWPTKTWSKVNGAVFFCYLKGALVICAYMRVHNARTLCLLHTQRRAAAQILKIKGFLKDLAVSINPPWREHNWLLKVLGDETLIGLLHVMPKTHPWLIKRLGTTLWTYADHFFHRWTSKSRFGHALSAPAPWASDHELRLLK